MNKLLSDILLDIYRGVYKIPRIDPSHHWPQSRCVDLLNSVLDGIPIGGLMVLNTHLDISTREDFPLTPINTNTSPIRQYVLDGHQRLSVLYSALGKGAVAASRLRDAEPLVAPAPGYYLNMSRRTFEAAPVRDHSEVYHFPACDILDSRKVLAYQRMLAQDHPKKVCLGENLEWMVTRFRLCVMPLMSFATNDITLAHTAFTRSNRGLLRLEIKG